MWVILKQCIWIKVFSFLTLFKKKVLPLVKKNNPTFFYCASRITAISIVFQL